MKIENLINIQWKKIDPSTIICYEEILELCQRPYPGHPYGCPNVKKCRGMDIPLFNKLNMDYGFEHFYLVYAVFDFKAYKQLRRAEHPDWTDRQVACVLYWQHSVKKRLKDFIEKTRTHNTTSIYVLACGSGMNLSFQANVGSMELASINVFSTLKLNNIYFEMRPESKIILCNLLCSFRPLSFNFPKQKCLEEYS